MSSENESAGFVANVKTYTKKERNMYLTGMFGQNMIYNIVATGLYFYFQNVICLPAVAIGWIMGLARVWDAINDPMMGVLVDRTKSKYGKCRSWLLFAPILVCIFTCLCFVNGNYSVAKQDDNSTRMFLIVAWAAISYILWGMSYTTGDVPLWGMISRMSDSAKDRSNLIAAARIIASVGGAIPLLTIVILSQAVNSMLDKGEMAQSGFIIVGIVMTVVGSVLFEFAGVGTKEHVASSTKQVSVGENFAIMWKCKPFRRLFISGLLRSPVQLILSVAMELLTYYYCNGNMNNMFKDIHTLIIAAIIAGGLFLGQFVAMGLCPMMIDKFDVKNVYNFASGLSAIPFALMYLIYAIAPTQLAEFGYAIPLAICMTLAGGGFGAAQTCQSVMISDCIDYEEYHNGFRPDGVFFSGQSFITKFSSGIASVISGYAFRYVGFTDVNIDKVNTALENGVIFATNPDYAGYSQMMWLLVSIPPAIGMAISIIPTIKYELTSKVHKGILDELVVRHQQNEETLEEGNAEAVNVDANVEMTEGIDENNGTNYGSPSEE